MNVLSLEQVMGRQKSQFFLSFFFYSKRSLTKTLLNYNNNITIIITIDDFHSLDKLAYSFDVRKDKILMKVKH